MNAPYFLDDQHKYEGSIGMTLKQRKTCFGDNKNAPGPGKDHSKKESK